MQFVRVSPSFRPPCLCSSYVIPGIYAVAVGASFPVVLSSACNQKGRRAKDGRKVDFNTWPDEPHGPCSCALSQKQGIAPGGSHISSSHANISKETRQRVAPLPVPRRPGSSMGPGDRLAGAGGAQSGGHGFRLDPWVASLPFGEAHFLSSFALSCLERPFLWQIKSLRTLFGPLSQEVRRVLGRVWISPESVWT